MSQLSIWDAVNILIFKEDCTELHPSFKKGTEFIYFAENNKNWFIWLEDCTYGPLKSRCMKVYK